MKNLPQTQFAKAFYSECQQYRYCLHKSRLPSPSTGDLLLWIMMNPSTATAEQDDPTVRKCQSLAYKWGFDGVTIANLYAYRSTNPAVLLSDVEIVGPANDGWLSDLIRSHPKIMCAWGSIKAKDVQRRVDLVMCEAKTYERNLYALKINKDGMPMHPLYASLKTTMKLWKRNVYSIR